MSHDDRAAVLAIRDAFVAADHVNDADAMLGLLSDDVVVMHPQGGVIEGREAASKFLRAVLADVAAEFTRRAHYSTLELKVRGRIRVRTRLVRADARAARRWGSNQRARPMPVAVCQER